MTDENGNKDPLTRLRERQEKELSTRVDPIREALDRYVQAVRTDAEADLLALLKLDERKPRTSFVAFMDVRAGVEALPEAHVKRIAEEPEPAPPTPQEIKPPCIQPASPDLTTGESVALIAKGRELWDEVQSLASMTCSQAELKARGEMLAARARALQDTRGSHSDSESFEGLSIRALTRIAADRRVYVYGLARAHTGDWSQQEEAAKRELAAELARQTRKDVGESPRAPPKVNKESLGSEDADAETRRDIPLEVPHLCRLSVQRAVVVVGGLVDHQKSKRLTGRSGVPLEWVAGEDVNASLVQRIRGGSIGAIVLTDFNSHGATEPVLSAAREHGVLVERGGRGGLASIAEALRALDTRIAEGARPTA